MEQNGDLLELFPAEELSHLQKAFRRAKDSDEL
jgi:hypothetical protein